MPKFSGRVQSNPNRDTKLIGKRRTVVISITEKRKELRVILHPEVQKIQKTLKKKTDEEILQILEIDEKIKEKYPQTKWFEKELLISGLMAEIKRLIP